MNFKDNESEQKLRGGYYTPKPIAQYINRWIMHNRPESILEPSCGDGEFLRSFEGLNDYKLRITGIEINEEEAQKARETAPETNLIDIRIINADFLKWSIEATEKNITFDAVVGNPPYIRYQYLGEEDQILAEKVFKKNDLKFSKHTNAWVPFVIASVNLLIPGGRLAMVIPSEILHVIHAGALRTFLVSECTRVLMIDPTELLFSEALQGTVILMIEKKISKNQLCEGVSIASSDNVDFLNTDPEVAFREARYVSGEALNGKWMKILLEQDEIQLFNCLEGKQGVYKFTDIASVDVGIVTGANKYFLINDETVAKFNLEAYVLPMFGRSNHCPGIIYDELTHSSNRSRGLPANFIMFGNTPFEQLPSKAQEYILIGEKEKYPKRYKCGTRKPWYSIPSVYSTPLSLLKRSHNFPRLIHNSKNAYTTDTAYRIKLIDANIQPERLVYSFINSITSLSAELEGRHYGGGVLELVPSEIERLLVPISNNVQLDLQSLDRDIRSDMNADDLLAQQDQRILTHIGFSNNEISRIHDAWKRIRNRRQRLITTILE